MKDYDTKELEFLFPVGFDKLCVIVPKALQIPQWILVFQCFSPNVWISFCVAYMACGSVWYFMKKINQLMFSLYNFRKQDKSKKMKSFAEIIIEMWLIMFSAPSHMMPTEISERLFLGACLLANLIISGTFQVFQTFQNKKKYKLKMY